MPVCVCVCVRVHLREAEVNVKRQADHVSACVSLEGGGGGCVSPFVPTCVQYAREIGKMLDDQKGQDMRRFEAETTAVSESSVLTEAMRSTTARLTALEQYCTTLQQENQRYLARIAELSGDAHHPSTQMLPS